MLTGRYGNVGEPRKRGWLGCCCRKIPPTAHAIRQPNGTRCGRRWLNSACRSACTLLPLAMPTPIGRGMRRAKKVRRSAMRSYRYAWRGRLALLFLEGVFDRHPGLKLISAENELSWAANFLSRLDWGYHRRTMAKDPMVRCQRLPSEYWHEHCYLTFIDDLPGVMLREFIGVERIMWSSDFPHLDSSWPESQRFLEKHLAAVPADEARPIVADNCMRVCMVWGRFDLRVFRKEQDGSGDPSCSQYLRIGTQQFGQTLIGVIHDNRPFGEVPFPTITDKAVVISTYCLTGCGFVFSDEVGVHIGHHPRLVSVQINLNVGYLVPEVGQFRPKVFMIVRVPFAHGLRGRYSRRCLQG